MVSSLSGLVIFFYKQETTYEMRISDWSSDVCSSDLPRRNRPRNGRSEREIASLTLIIIDPPPEKFSEAATSMGAAERIVLNDEIGRATCRERVCQYV